MRVLLVSSAVAVAVAATSGISAEEPKTKREQLVCKSERRTGTRFGSRTCRTERDRQKQIDEHRKAADEMINRPVIAPPGN